MFQFAKSWDQYTEPADGGDPSLAYLPPLEQWANQHLYSTLTGPIESGVFTHYGRLVIDKNQKDGIL